MFMGKPKYSRNALSEFNIDIKKPGNGNFPKVGSFVSVNYKGKLVDGTVFDSTDGKSPFEFILGIYMVIPCWDKAFALMSVGE